jgi:mono/diheme cytochrome c family protein
MKAIHLLAVAVAGGALISVAFTAQASNERAGEDIYFDKCVFCHDSRGWGTRVLARRTPPGEGELTKRKDLPAAYTEIVVRRGLNAMPPFTPTDLSDEEIARVSRWLDEQN